MPSSGRQNPFNRPIPTFLARMLQSLPSTINDFVGYLVKKIHLVYVTAALLTAAPGHAASLGNSNNNATPSLMLYSATPLDGSPRQKAAFMQFGFRLDYAGSSSQAMDQYSNQPVTGRPAFFDFSVNGNRLPTMKINGISALTYELSSNVAGAAGAVATGVNWTYVAYGVAATAAAKKTYDNRHDDPPQETPAPAPVGCAFTFNIRCSQ